MILTPEQIGPACYDLEWDRSMDDSTRIDIAHTLAAYAEIVEKVAEDKFYCCGAYLNGRLAPHTPDCLYIAARKLRGLE